MISSAVASSIQLGGGSIFGDSGLATILFGTISGGITAELTGEDGALRKCLVDIFSERASMCRERQGAATGLVVSGLNHVAHRGDAKDSFEITEEKVEPTGGELEDGFLPPGKIRFEGLKDRHLKQFRVIPENNSELILPDNDVTYNTDGFYHQNTTEDKYWYKIGGGRKVVVTYNGKSFDLLKSIFNPLGLGSYIGWKPKSKPHWTINPFYQ